MFALLHIQHPAPPFRRRQDSLIFFRFYELCASFSKIAHIATITLHYYTMFLLPFQQVLAFPIPAAPLSLRSSKAALYDRSAQNKGAALRPLPFLRRAGSARPAIRLQRILALSSPLFGPGIRFGLIGQPQQIVHADAVIGGEGDEDLRRDRPLSQFVIRIAYLRAIQIFGQFSLRQVFIYPQIPDSMIDRKSTRLNSSH